MSAFLAWIRVALVDLRGDLRRFGILLACLALGVGTIAIVGSVGAALEAALDRDARQLLGGDFEASLSYRLATPEERELLDSLGTVAQVVEIMGNGIVGEQSVFLSLKAVDANYPLVGDLTISEPIVAGATLPELLAPRDGVHGLVADTLLIDRIGMAIGDRMNIGAAEFELRGLVSGAPDQLTQGLAIGIPAMVSVNALLETGTIEPGVVARYRYKLLLADGIEPEEAGSRIATAFPDQGWQLNTPQDATADLARFFNIFARFLTIVALSALIVGGVGVSNAIGAYVTERQRSIATLKAMGATSARILTHFLTQVGLLTLVGIVLGLVFGAIVTVIVLPVLGDLLGIDLPPVIDPVSLLTASGFGILVSFAFAFLPLKRAETLRPALLFRAAGGAVEGGLSWRQLGRPSLLIPLLVATGLIYLLALATTSRPELVFWYAVGVLASFLILRGAGYLLQRVLKLVPLPRNAALRNGLKSIYRPGAPAPIVILSLGLGLALLLLIALIDNNLRHQLDQESIPDAPSFVFMDLFDDEVETLTAYSAGNAQIEAFEANAMLRGMVESIDGVPASELAERVDADFAFLFTTEAPLTADAELPARSSVVDGEWWPADYDGPPLISVFKDLRAPLGIEVGSQMVLRIFGEEVTATVANFRDFVWRGGGINFALVMSPGILEEFPVSYIGLLKTVPGEERAVQQQLVAEFPQTVFLPVSEALDLFATILDSVTNAVALVGGLAVVSGLLVLAGAMAAGRRQREADAVMMKVMGATRGDIVRSYLVEYGLLGTLAAVIAAGLGLVGAWAVVELVMEIDFNVNPLVIVAVIVSTVVLTIAVGVATTWSALSIKPSGYLREE